MKLKKLQLPLITQKCECVNKHNHTNERVMAVSDRSVTSWLIYEGFVSPLPLLHVILLFVYTMLPKIYRCINTSSTVDWAWPPQPLRIWYIPHKVVNGNLARTTHPVLCESFRNMGIMGEWEKRLHTYVVKTKKWAVSMWFSVNKRRGNSLFHKLIFWPCGLDMRAV